MTRKSKKSKNKNVEKAFKCKYCYGTHTGQKAIADHELNCKVSIYPAVKAPVEFSSQVTSGDYILWNTLGKCPFAATVTV